MNEAEAKEFRWSGPLIELPQATSIDGKAAVLLVLDICGERSEIVAFKRHYRAALKAVIGDFIVSYGVVRDNRLFADSFGNLGTVQFTEGAIIHELFKLFAGGKVDPPTDDSAPPMSEPQNSTVGRQNEASDRSGEG